jgi:hypothetical protein
MLVEFEHVAGEVRERPLAADGVQAAAAEVADGAVVFAVAKDRFDQADLASALSLSATPQSYQ